MSRRASLPGAEELFRRTGAERARAGRAEPASGPQEDKSTKLQVATPPKQPAPAPKAPKHDEKITFYCTGDDLMTLEGARLKLRSDQGIAADRGRIVRAALGYVLEDFDARGEDSVLVRRLESEE
ncbi:MAG: hypothetical protein ACRDJJ_05805 [Actinomycetota bacterium]